MSFTSCVAKSAVAEILFEAGCEEVRIPTKHWFRLMEGEESVVKDLWNKCLAEAAPALLEEGFIKKAAEVASSFVEKVDWKRVPISLFVYVLRLDFLVTTEEGDTIGVITDLHKNSENMDALMSIRPLLDFLGIDALVWCQVRLSDIEGFNLYVNRKKALAQDVLELLADVESAWIHEWIVEDTSTASTTVEAASAATATVTV